MLHVTTAATTLSISIVCPKCGITRKSGKVSCCGRSGSWFGLCGSAGNTQLAHTWHEGVQACKTRARFKTAMGRQPNAAQQLNNLNGAPTTTLTPVNTRISTSAHISFANTAAHMPMTAPAHTGALNASTIIASDTNNIFVATTTTAVITRTVEEATVVTDWISQGMY